MNDEEEDEAALINELLRRATLILADSRPPHLHILRQPLPYVKTDMFRIEMDTTKWSLLTAGTFIGTHLGWFLTLMYFVCGWNMSMPSFLNATQQKVALLIRESYLIRPATHFSLQLNYCAISHTFTVDLYFLTFTSMYSACAA